MKTYILVHHRCEQDPRVLHVSETVRFAGHEVALVGIASVPAITKNAFTQIHVPKARVYEIYAAFVPLTRLYLADREKRLSRILLVPVILALILLLALITIIFLPALYLIRIIQRRGLVSKTKTMKALVNGLRGLFAPLTYFISFLCYFVSFHRFLREKNDIEVLHCNDLETLLVGVYFKTFHGVRVIYDAHEFFPYQATWLKGFPQKLLISYEKALVQHADVLFTVSKLLGEAMQEVYKLDKDYTIVPNVFSRKYLSKSTGLTQSYPIRFHYIGGFLEERGIEFLIEAWGAIDPNKAILHLRGPRNAFYDQCENYAKSQGLWNTSVFFQNAVSEAELINVARNYDVGIIPYIPMSLNNRYCCPNKLSQYMLAGNAILSNNLPNIAAYLDEFQNGFSYDSERPQTFIDAVNGLCDLQNLNLRRQNSRLWAEKKYNWEVEGQAFADAYKALNAQIKKTSRTKDTN